MKKILLTALTVGLLVGCTEPEIFTPDIMNLGSDPVSTSIISRKQDGNKIDITFSTTPGAKYSVQVYPFGIDEPIKIFKFTATEETTNQIYDLSGLEKRDYDLIFIDVKGNETKTPILIK